MVNIDVEQHYQHYLKLVKLDEKTMHPTQKKQLRETWFGAYAHFLVVMDEISGMEPEEGAKAIDQINFQVTNFWLEVKINEKPIG